MSIQTDRWITRMALEHKMIEPFEGRQVRTGVISYGVSSYGYDMRVASEFRIFTNVLNSIVDPKDFDPKSFVEFKGDICIVPPNSFALARSVEYFRIPRDVVTISVGKRTYARCGIITNVTPFEPEWEGLRHARDLQHDAPAGQDLRQRGDRPGALLPGDEPPEISYKDKKGKYQASRASPYPACNQHHRPGRTDEPHRLPAAEVLLEHHACEHQGCDGIERNERGDDPQRARVRPPARRTRSPPRRTCHTK